MTTIIDYGLGNLASIINALDKLEVKSRISASPSAAKNAKALILPGVGTARQGMKNLTENGLDKIIIREIKSGKPILGICLGMQLLFEKSSEGNVSCLGLVSGKVKKFKKKHKVPQVGWNRIKIQNAKFKMQNHNSKFKIFKNIPDKSYFYFVNSYYCKPRDEAIVAATSKYGEKFASMIVKDNIVATQFHPEKSGKIGLMLTKNIFNYLFKLKIIDS